MGACSEGKGHSEISVQTPTFPLGEKGLKRAEKD